MEKKPKREENLHVKIKAEVNEKLIDFCNDTGISKTAAVEKALTLYIEQYRETGRI